MLHKPRDDKTLKRKPSIFKRLLSRSSESNLSGNDTSSPVDDLPTADHLAVSSSISNGLDRSNGRPIGLGITFRDQPDDFISPLHLSPLRESGDDNAALFEDDRSSFTSSESSDVFGLPRMTVLMVSSNSHALFDPGLMPVPLRTRTSTLKSAEAKLRDKQDKLRQAKSTPVIRHSYFEHSPIDTAFSPRHTNDDSEAVIPTKSQGFEDRSPSSLASTPTQLDLGYVTQIPRARSTIGYKQTEPKLPRPPPTPILLPTAQNEDDIHRIVLPMSAVYMSAISNRNEPDQSTLRPPRHPGLGVPKQSRLNASASDNRIGRTRDIYAHEGRSIRRRILNLTHISDLVHPAYRGNKSNKATRKVSPLLTSAPIHSDTIPDNEENETLSHSPSPALSTLAIKQTPRSFVPTCIHRHYPNGVPVKFQRAAGTRVPSEWEVLHAKKVEEHAKEVRDRWGDVAPTQVFPYSSYF